MQKIRKRRWSLTLAAVFCWVGVACSANNGQSTNSVSTTNSGDSASTETTDTSRLVYGSGDYTRINPAMDEHGEIVSLLFDGLTDHDGNNQVIPRLAKSWEYDPKTITYTFHLEQNVKWHDGKPFTAEDVKFTLEQIMNPDNQSENAPNYEDVQEITILDEHTLSIRLKAVNHAFLDYMSIAILPKHLLEGEDMQESDFFRFPIGTGPYKMKEWQTGQAILLEKNEKYFAGPAKIEEIVFKILPDSNAKALQLNTGELTLAQVTPKDALAFENQDEFELYKMKTSDYRGILYNFANPFWQKNQDLIPAISYGIDKQAILDTVVLGKGKVAYSPLQRNEYNYPEMEKYEYNPQKAEQLLQQAGCEKDAEGFWQRDGERITFTINAPSDDQVRIDMAQIAAQQLREIGLDVKAEVPVGGIDWSNQECSIIGWGSPFDADDHTYKVFGTDKGANYSSYSNPEVDKFLLQARQTDDQQQRAEAYKNFQIALAEKPAYTFFCYIDAIYVADTALKGIDTNRILGHHGVGIFWNVCDWELES